MGYELIQYQQYETDSVLFLWQDGVLLTSVVIVAR